MLKLAPFYGVPVFSVFSLAHFESTLTSGFLEGINSLIQSAKTRARGYRNLDNLIAIAYIIAGRLKFNTLFPLLT